MTINQHQRSIKTVLQEFAIEAPDIMLVDLVLDSREVAVHAGFIAIKGHALDGRDFIPQAISLGAKVIISDADYASQHGKIEMREQSIIVHFYDLATNLSHLSACFYGYPAQQLDIIAVTGTNGKTSTVQLVSQLRYLQGEGAGSIGTLGAGMYSANMNDLQQTLNTTPDACQVQRLLARFVRSGAKQVALEASSHALVQNRISGLKTDVAVFTNLTRDHLDYHGTMEEYAAAKRLLINQPELKHLVINADDTEATNWLRAAHPAQSIVLYSTLKDTGQLPSQHQYCVAKDIQFNDMGVSFSLVTSWGNAFISTPLFGMFNISNLLAAIATQLVLGKSFDAILPLCNEVKPVAGRMELFSHDTFANVLVDYAHTPDALEQALISARQHCHGVLTCVFGCGGDRDKGKRPLMGEIAQRLSDKVIVTSDNSRSESPHTIVSEILAGMAQNIAVSVELDRKQAIKLALQTSHTGDLILVAGKGHEDYQIIAGQRLQYNEREYVQQLLQRNR